MNDATAACAAELTFGNPQKHDNFLYIHIGYFMGGGVVLNGSVFAGPSGNAGALAALPVRLKSTNPHATGENYQLIRDTSKISLQRMLETSGEDASIVWDIESDWSVLGKTLDIWLNHLAEGLAYAITSATAIIDFPAVVIDGDLPPNIRKRVTQLVTEELQSMDQQGLSPVTVVEGSLGSNARLIGGASLPLLATFSRDRSVAFGDL
jgi:predicted NBD/HSP70 family sugar kinase